MASLAEKRQIDEELAKIWASAERDQRRTHELEGQRAYLRDNIRSSMVVPAAAGATSSARAYYGDEAFSICGISLDAALGVLLKVGAALLGFSSNEEAQTAAMFLHDIGNGALASWTTKLGAELGVKKRMEKLLPAPQPNTGAGEMPKFGPGPLTHEDLAAIERAMALKAKRAMPQLPSVPAPPRPHPLPPAHLPPPVQQETKPKPAMELPPLPRPHAPPPAPPSMPAQQKMTPPPSTEPEAAKVPAPAPVFQSMTPPQSPLNGQPAPFTPSAKSEAAPEVPSTLQTPSRATKPWVFDPEAEMRALLQSQGAPADPKTVAYVLMHENSIDAYRQIVGRARAPTAAPSNAQQLSRATKSWVLDPEAEMRALLQSHGAPSDPKTVNYLLSHETPFEALRAIVRVAQVPTTQAAAASVPAPAPVPQSSTPLQSPLNAPPTKKTPRRSLGVARAVGIT